MHSNNAVAIADMKTKTAINYDQAEKQFIELLVTEDLDNRLDELHSVVNNIEENINFAIAAAYQTASNLIFYSLNSHLSQVSFIFTLNIH